MTLRRKLVPYRVNYTLHILCPPSSSNKVLAWEHIKAYPLFFTLRVLLAHVCTMTLSASDVTSGNVLRFGVTGKYRTEGGG